MAEIDYQMALLLQYKLEQEHKRKEATDSDHQLALELQEQFKTELEIEQPTNNLVYKAPHVSNSKSLVDPSWEVIDPTPDIHVLFITFNKKFFWDSLGSVTVSWSKRMTTCAGICSYQGRGGMCSITLSEPLLKLRPRKDLVETLLHEMIHAYLFVTNNNRDRDGHGPEFHKHMYRINAEAGTNITVYHDFHDEVRLYKQHWWRCDGPCQQRKPYFGIIRRATNRAPGPNDRWWAEHMRNCGGTFIKVKSPEKPVKADKTTTKKTKAPPKEVSPQNDIRNYITSSSKPSGNSQNNKENISQPNLTTNKLHTVSNVNRPTSDVGNVIPSKTSNIFGFTNLSGKNSKRPGGALGVRGAVKNSGSSTFVVTNKGSKTTTSGNISNSDAASSSASDIQPFSGTGRTLSGTSASPSDKRDYSIVRDHWLKKFDNNSQPNGIKRFSNSCSYPNAQKISKLAKPNKGEQNKVDCPVCKGKFKQEDLNDHLDVCLETSNDGKKECIICGDQISVVNYEQHVTDCTAKHFSGVFEDELTCSKAFDSEHIKNCRTANIVDLTSSHDEESDSCPVCKKILSSEEYGVHVQNCILSQYDDFDKQTSCLACGKNILKNQLDAHLENCISMNNVFDTTNVTVEDNDDCVDAKGNSVPESSYNCPFCLKLVLENQMQTHLDRCLKAEDILGDDNFKE